MNTNWRHSHMLVQLTLFAALLISLAMPVAGAAAAPKQRCFRETGLCVSGRILEYWERNGGLPIFGYPISDETIETIEGSWSGPTQWFERDRLEDHSNEGKGVLAGRLGAGYLENTGRPWQMGMPMPYNPDCVFVNQTEYNMCGMFLTYWQKNGGLARFGYPITDPIEEQIEGQTYWVQYFERRRMEVHATRGGTSYDAMVGTVPGTIMLGLLGRDLYTVPAFTPMDMARETLTTFLRELSVGNYTGGAARYAGDYEQLLNYNPDVTGSPQSPDVQALLWQRACTKDGFFCLPVRDLISGSQQDANTFTFVVSLSAADGKLFHGAEGRTRFTLHVQRIGGQYFVTDLPPYLS